MSVPTGIKFPKPPIGNERITHAMIGDGEKPVTPILPMNSPLCERCEKRPTLPTDEYCEECLQNMAEAAYERRMEDGETFRGNEAAAFAAEEQERARRLK